MPNPDVRPMGAISRREVLQLGVPVLGLGLADILRARASAGPSSDPPRRRSLIVFWTHGGMSQQDTYDLKPDAPAQFRGAYRPIATSAPGVSVTERFPRQ